MIKNFKIFLAFSKFNVNIIKYNKFQPQFHKKFSDIDESLREIQMRPKYEAAISNIIIGENSKAINFLDELLIDLKEERKQYTEDYIFLLKKIISVNKINKDLIFNTKYLYELHLSSLKIFRYDFNSLFETVEYIIINLINSDPIEAINYIKLIVDDNLFPNFFNHIFMYYLGTAYGIEGKKTNLEKSIQIFHNIIDEIDDEYLKGCVINNYACIIWWSRISNFIQEIEEKKSYDIVMVRKIANETFNIVNLFKRAILLIEGENNIKNELFQKFLSKDFDLNENIEKELIQAINSNKNLPDLNKSTALILTNLGELYYNSRLFNKSIITISFANSYFNKNNNQNPLYYKNFSLLAMCYWKMFSRKSSIQTNEIFSKIISQTNSFSNCYEKVFILRIYSEFLFEENKNSIEANNHLMEAKTIEDKLSPYDCRKICLIFPNE